MKSSQIQSFVSEAQRELSKITPQIEALTERRNSLQEVVSGALKLLRKTTQPEPTQPETSSNSALQKQPFSLKREVWENIAEALRVHGRPMMPKDIVDALERLGTPVGGNFPRDHVRSAMRRRPITFEPLGQGLWGLKAWSADKSTKQARERVQVHVQ